MKPVERREIVDFETYKDQRPQYRARVMELKAPRRVHVGEHLTFLFENHETIRYQVQEMVLAERIVREADIQHELATYNELLGGPGELGASLLIEIDDPRERGEKLRRWTSLPATVYARLEDGTLVRPEFDPRQIDDGKLSSVHYVKFRTGGRVPVAIGCELPDIAAETVLDEQQRRALAEDLASH